MLLLTCDSVDTLGVSMAGAGWTLAGVSLTTRRTAAQLGTLELSASLGDRRRPCWTEQSVWSLPLPGWFTLLPVQCHRQCTALSSVRITGMVSITSLRWDQRWQTEASLGTACNGRMVFNFFWLAYFKKKIKRRVIFCDLWKVYEIPSWVSINGIL